MIYYDGRLLLIYYAVKYRGDYQKIMTAIELHEEVAYEEAIKVNDSLKCKTLTYLDYDYPFKLKQVYQPPLVLFYYGDISLLHKRILGVVGSRDYSDYGKLCAEKVIEEIIPGNVLISGLARGIDTVAHETALKNHAQTIAVLGCGIDAPCYPPENQELLDELKKDHLVLSEYPFDEEPDRSHFPQRNRIIAGLSDALFIPQINSYMSGTMITYSIALTLGKPIIVAPHPIDSPTINNELLHEGAIIPINRKQILYEIDWHH